MMDAVVLAAVQSAAVLSSAAVLLIDENCEGTSSAAARYEMCSSEVL